MFFVTIQVQCCLCKNIRDLTVALSKFCDHDGYRLLAVDHEEVQASVRAWGWRPSPARETWLQWCHPEGGCP